jgi:fructokinase
VIKGPFWPEFLLPWSHNMVTTPRVIAFGELLWDLLPSGAQLGGAPANFALRVQSLGLPVALVSRIGKDPLGEEALAILSHAGLDTSYIQVDDQAPTGSVQVTLDASGNASYSITKGVAYDFIQLPQPLKDLASKVDVICFGSLVQRAISSQTSLYDLLQLAPKATKIVDINLRKDCFTSETVEGSLRSADILKLNSDEVAPVCEMLGLPVLEPELFAGAMCERFSLSHVLVTRGADGVYGYKSDGEEVTIPGYKVAVVDTIGSGDAFTAGFVSKLLVGAPFGECCDFGNRLGAAVAQKKGGMSPCSIEEALAL